MNVGGIEREPRGRGKHVRGDDVQGAVQRGGQEQRGRHDGDCRTPDHVKTGLIQNDKVVTHQVRVQFGQSLEVSLYELGGAGPDQALKVLWGED